MPHVDRMFLVYFYPSTLVSLLFPFKEAEK